MKPFVFLVLFLASLPHRAGAATVTYSALVDTSALAGSTGSLDFNFEPGPFGAQFATVQVANFSGDGLPFGVATVAGDTSGTLPGTVSLDNGTGFNDYFQDFTFGSTLSFDIALSGPALGSSNRNASGSTFAFSIFSDMNGTVPALTSNTADGYAITVDIDPDGSTTLRNYTNQSTAVTPEPPTVTLLIAAAMLAWVFRNSATRERCNSHVVSTFNESHGSALERR